jgi:toxin ParE1/3/4
VVESANRKEGGPLSVFSLTDQARTDLAEISDYLEDHADEEAATRLIEAVHRACSLIADSPAIGRSLPDFGPGIRVYVLGSYQIFYRDLPSAVLVLRVLHERRNIRRIFGA